MKVDEDDLWDEEAVLTAIKNHQLALHSLEQKLSKNSNMTEEKLRKAVRIRRKALGLSTDTNIPWEADLQYSSVYGRCCENVIGYVTVPLGVITGAIIDGKQWTIPMATTEGALIASTQRGFKAISKASLSLHIHEYGVQTHVHADGMTRAPIVHFENLDDAIKLKYWILKPENYSCLEGAFNATSSYARLIKASYSMVLFNLLYFFYFFQAIHL